MPVIWFLFFVMKGEDMFKILKHLNWKQWLLVILAGLFIGGQVVLELKLPDFMSEITTLLQSGGEIKDIWQNGLYMLLCALASGLISVIVGFISARIGASLSMNLREKVYSKVATFSPTELHRFSVSSLITRSTNDITQVQRVFSMGLQVVIRAPIMAILAIIKIANKSWQWSLATAISVVVIISVTLLLTLLCLPKFKSIQKQTDDLNRITQENLTGLRVIKAFNAEDYENEKFDGVNEKLTKTHKFTQYALSFFNPMLYIVMDALALAIYIIGAFIINSTTGLNEKMLIFSDMVVFYSYAMMIISSFMMMVMIFMMLPRAQVSAKRIQEVLDTNSTIVDGKGVNPTKKGTIEFDNVSFGYADANEPVIKNISFKVNQGEKIAIIGGTGSGKSTIIKLILRFYDATTGTIKVDGENVKDYKLSDLYDKIGYISQKAVLFSGTIEDNITLGKVNGEKVNKQDVVDAVRQSQSSQFVENLEKTYSAEVYQGGSNFSGGQKQRLSIARALSRKPEILIFDDSFSALDYKTDKILRDTLNSEFKDTTCVIIGQRVGTIAHCDKILVVDNGEIMGMGTHQELLNSCEIYKDIALSQLSKEELEHATNK